MPVFKKSTRKNKKYMVRNVLNKTFQDKWIHFGDIRYQHFNDTTGLKLYSYLDHHDKIRQQSYLKRAKGIRNKKGELTYLDKNSPNYYSVNYLW
jgi:hypothetical protein